MTNKSFYFLGISMDVPFLPPDNPIPLWNIPSKNYPRSVITQVLAALCQCPCYWKYKNSPTEKSKANPPYFCDVLTSHFPDCGGATGWQPCMANPVWNPRAPQVRGFNTKDGLILVIWEYSNFRMMNHMYIYNYLSFLNSRQCVFFLYSYQTLVI